MAAPTFTAEESAAEEWRHLPRHGLWVSSLGRYSGAIDATGEIVAPSEGFTDRRGYRLASVRGRNVLAHRLVLEAFVGPCPEGMQACHNDGDRMNTRVGNLRWDTPKANSADRWRHGTTGVRIAPYLDRLGTLPDATIAAMAGCTHQNVAHARRVRGIPAHRSRPQP